MLTFVTHVLLRFLFLELGGSLARVGVCPRVSEASLSISRHINLLQMHFYFLQK